MATITSPLDTSEVIWSVHLREAPSIEELISHLLDILDSHREASDELSLRLSSFGHEISEILLGGEPSEDFLLRLATKIHELRAIAINPLDRSPLQNPFEAGGRIWEKWMLDHVVEIFGGVSPYEDGAPLSDARAHFFAQALLQWVDLIFTTDDLYVKRVASHLSRMREEEDRSKWLSEEEVKKEPLLISMREYMTLARSAERLHDLEALKTVLDEGVSTFSAIMEVTKEKTAMYVEQVRKVLVEGEARQAKDLAEIRLIYGEMIDRLRKRLGEAHEENRVLGGRVSDLSERLGRAEGDVRSLRDRLRHAEDQNRANAEAACSGGGGCVIM